MFDWLRPASFSVAIKDEVLIKSHYKFGAAMTGGLISAWGWNGFFAILCGCEILAIALILPLWSIKTTPETTSQEDENIARENI